MTKETKSIKSSPRPWRCFLCPQYGCKSLDVFSTSVEVFLRNDMPTIDISRVFSTCEVVEVGLLHVRGGVSDILGLRPLIGESSPRPWRCFLLKAVTSPNPRVFSTSVEVFLTTSLLGGLRERLLHVRGGVSGDQRSGPTASTSSPRPWRCFHNDQSLRGDSPVFSTSVEVFLRFNRLLRLLTGLLHVRGGVSWDATKRSAGQAVFSTSVEVFLTSRCRSFRATCLLHVRGGVFA